MSAPNGSNLVADEARIDARIPPLTRRSGKDQGDFRVVVAAHLRSEKDPLRTALAVRALGSKSRIHVHHFGAAYDDQWRSRAEAESAANDHYTWYGPIPQAHLDRVYRAADLMVISSRMEGGANVVSEAVAADLPILATQIPGNVGLLQSDYRGYFPLAETSALTRKLERCEADRTFLAQLREQIRSLGPRFSAERERDHWLRLVRSLG